VREHSFSKPSKSFFSGGIKCKRLSTALPVATKASESPTGRLLTREARIKSQFTSSRSPKAKKGFNIQEESTIIYFTASPSINLPSSQLFHPSIHFFPPITMPEQKRKIDGAALALADWLFS
jgi:hypothetical protein